MQKCNTLKGEWDSSLNELQRMLILRSLRPDRVSFCVYKFIVNNLGSKFVEPPVLDLKAIYDDSNCRIPLIFVLSSGVVSILILKIIYITILFL
jgi:dynein heavy chain, axonemal